MEVGGSDWVRKEVERGEELVVYLSLKLSTGCFCTLLIWGGNGKSCVDLEGRDLLVLWTGNSNTVGSFIHPRSENWGSDEEWRWPSFHARGAWIYNLSDKKWSNKVVVPQQRISIQLCSVTISGEKNSSFPPEGFPGSSAGKEYACNVGDLGPGLGRSPGEGKGYKLQHSGLENSMDRGAWQATYSPWVRKVGHDWRFSLHFPSEGLCSSYTSL